MGNGRSARNNPWNAGLFSGHVAESVETRIEYRFPGVALSSTVQGWVYLEDFAQGIKEFGSLAAPSAADLRWLGVCYFQLFDDAKALHAFAEALARGEGAARVNLAHLLQVSNRAEEAAQELEKIDVAQLEPYDQAFFLRVRSIHEENNGNIREALRFAEEAWRRLQGIPEFKILAPSVLTQLGILHGRVGRAQRAMWFLDRAAQLTVGLEQLKIKMRWATVAVAQGEVNRVLDEILSHDFSSAPEPIQVEQEWLLGEVYWHVQKFERAIEHYQQATALAKKNEIAYEEFLSRVALATLYAHMQQNKYALRELQRAQQLISDRSDRLQYRFREILVFHWRGFYRPRHAIAELETVGRGFGDMGLLQEQGSVKLHVAALRQSISDPACSTDLDALRALGLTLQNPHYLEREAALLPSFDAKELLAHVAEKPA